MKDGAVWQQLSVIASGELYLWYMESFSVIFGNDSFFRFMRGMYNFLHEALLWALLQTVRITLWDSSWKAFFQGLNKQINGQKMLLNSAVMWSLLTHSHLCVIFPYMAHSRSWHLFLWVLPVWSRLEGGELQLFYSYRHLYVQFGTVVQRSWSVCVWELWMHSARGLRLHLRQMPHLPWCLYLEEVSVSPILNINNMFRIAYYQILLHIFCIHNTKMTLYIFQNMTFSNVQFGLSLLEQSVLTVMYFLTHYLIRVPKPWMCKITICISNWMQ